MWNLFNRLHYFADAIMDSASPTNSHTTVTVSHPISLTTSVQLKQNFDQINQKCTRLQRTRVLGVETQGATSVPGCTLLVKLTATLRAAGRWMWTGSMIDLPTGGWVQEVLSAYSAHFHPQEGRRSLELWTSSFTALEDSSLASPAWLHLGCGSRRRRRGQNK